MTTENAEGHIDRLRNKWLNGYRVKIITSGPMREVYIYPTPKDRSGRRAAKRMISRLEQQKLNDKNAQLRYVRYLHKNFTKGDLLLTLTYEEGYIPTEAQAHDDVAEFLRAIRLYRERRGMAELKYIYVIEFGGEGGKERRIHHHIIMNKMDRNDAETIWGRGRANCRSLQPDVDGSLEGIARYITKEKRPPKHDKDGRATSRKRWAHSRNLDGPDIVEKDNIISRRRVQQIAMDCRVAGKELFARIFPGYKQMECQVWVSDFVPGAFIYSKMYQEKGWNTG
jgi:hypothetical protein